MPRRENPMKYIEEDLSAAEIDSLLDHQYFEVEDRKKEIWKLLDGKVDANTIHNYLEQAAKNKRNFRTAIKMIILGLECQLKTRLKNSENIENPMIIKPLKEQYKTAIRSLKDKNRNEPLMIELFGKTVKVPATAEENSVV